MPLRKTMIVVLAVAAVQVFCSASAQVWDMRENQPAHGLAPTKSSSQIKPTGQTPTFKLQAVIRKNLPPEMYGTWAIHALVLNTDAPPEFYTPSSEEIWTLQNTDGVITLQNLLNHASASIEVDNVVGNRATFHHAAIVAHRMSILETPTLAVQGDTLRGINVQELRLLSHDRVVAVYHLQIQITGNRLSGPRVTFSNTPDNRPRFEVAPMQYRK